VIETARVPLERSLIDARVLRICAWSVALAIGFVAQALVGIIGLVTNIAFYGRFSTAFVSPAQNHRGWLVLFSRIPARVTILKPLSAAISIGTGGPFGAEGPIIATGGALGSLVGQIFTVTATERKTLLAAGAAAGMAATFGSPVSAVLLAIELLLFEFRPRSIIPVALASVTSTAVRMLYVGTNPIFAMPLLARPSGEAYAAYALVGAIVGWLAVYVTRAIYWIEDLFEHLPIHWMWWPAIGGLAVGAIGIFAPRTLGVGYDNIEGMVAGKILGQAVIWLCFWKFVSWSISLGSGTPGGTLAPLFTIGGGGGVALGELFARTFRNSESIPEFALSSAWPRCSPEPTPARAMSSR